MFAIIPEPMFYDWGNTRLINHYFQRSVPDSLTLAELWMGTHPRGASRLAHPKNNDPLSTGVTLMDVVKLYPEETLGHNWSTPDGIPGLPFLFKILSAGKALSIQVHPSLDQARVGFAREDENQIPLSSPQRNYKDQNHKPECMYALSEFFALRGLRDPNEIQGFLMPAVGPLGSAIRELQNPHPSKGLKNFLGKLLTLDERDRLTAIEILVNFATTAMDKQNPVDPYSWFLELNSQFPGDVGVFAAFYLHIIQLHPGQALVLKAGELHAYLRGIGIELMANSDNVLRAGCTSKHVDIPELLKVTDFDPADSNVLTVSDGSFLGGDFPEFRLMVQSVDLDTRKLPSVPGPRILLCLEGTITLTASGETGNTGMTSVQGFSQTITLGPGQAAFLAPNEQEIGLEVNGKARWAMAADNFSG